MASYASSKSKKQTATVPSSNEHLLNDQDTEVLSLQAQQREEENNRLLLTIPQVAHQLGVSRAHVYRLIHHGLPTIHLGRSVRVSMLSLQKWVREQET